VNVALISTNRGPMCDVLIMADKNNPAQGLSGRSSRKSPRPELAGG
jgi:hypothetical protein